jgi:hypothetical protein
MTERQLAKMVAVGLHLQKPYACVELGGYVNVLILEGHNTYESRIVGTNMRDVAPGPIAKCWVAVAADFFLNRWTVEKEVNLGDYAADGCNEKIEADCGQYEEIQQRLDANLFFAEANGHGGLFWLGDQLPAQNAEVQ